MVKIRFVKRKSGDTSINKDGSFKQTDALKKALEGRKIRIRKRKSFKRKTFGSRFV